MDKKTAEKMYLDPFGSKIRYGIYNIEWSKPFFPKNYLIISNGPDKDIDINEREIWKFNKDELISHIIDKIYDPTNGLISNGDIIYAEFLWKDLIKRYQGKREFLADLKYWIWINLGIDLREY